MHQDCKVASSTERPPPKQDSSNIQHTFEIIDPFTLNNTHIHHGALYNGSPTKHDRQDSDTVLEKRNININLINERSDVNKETHCDKNNIETDLKDNNEYKDSTSIHSNVHSLDKGQETKLSYPKQDIRGFKTSKNGYGTQHLSQKYETNEVYAKLKINQDCDSENDLFSNRNHENSRCNDNNDNHRQNKE